MKISKEFTEEVFVFENTCILIEMSLKFVPNGPVYYKLALMQIIAW